MPNLNPLIYTAADFKLFLGISGGKTYPLLTTDSVEVNTNVEEEFIFAVGFEDAIGNKKNARKRSGKLNLQLGEINSILLLEGLQDATFITGATLAISAVVGAFNRTLRQVNINTEVFTIKAKDKSILVPMDWTALELL